MNTRKPGPVHTDGRNRATPARTPQRLRELGALLGMTSLLRASTQEELTHADIVLTSRAWKDEEP